MTRDSITTTADSAISAAVRGCSIIESTACR
jgi:hypothetical protein